MYGAKESAKPLVTLDTFENKYEQPRRKKSTVKSRHTYWKIARGITRNSIVTFIPPSVF